jgi:H+/Cl- antiporter ClcA
MKKWFNNNLLYLLGAVLGAVAGYLYWKLVGCNSGTCAITSKPLNSTVYGAIMGALLLGIFKKENKSVTDKK